MKNYRVSTTREHIIETAKSKSFGGFVNTDGDWGACRTPREFARFLEECFGFDVVDCEKTEVGPAVAIIQMGRRILFVANNGHVSFR